eukprot:7296625-Lingulodinium_polyedra.AAC.1
MRAIARPQGPGLAVGRPVSSGRARGPCNGRGNHGRTRGRPGRARSSRGRAGATRRRPPVALPRTHDGEPIQGAPHAR